MSELATEAVSVGLTPIEDDDLPQVAAFLQQHFSDYSVDDWVSAVEQPWGDEGPNRGFMLRNGEGGLLGAYVAYYSRQWIGGREERFCNLGAWYVLPEHRFHSLRLIRAILAQEGFHFTDVTPREEVIEIDKRLGFRLVDSAAVLITPLSMLSRHRAVRISSEAAEIEQMLSGVELQRFRDHASARGVIHAAVEFEDTSFYLVAGKERRKRLPVLRLLHIGDPMLFRRLVAPIGRHLLRHHRAIGLILERRMANPPAMAVGLPAVQPCLVRSETLAAELTPYLYTELVCNPW